MVYYNFIMSNEQRSKGGKKGRFRTSDAVKKYHKEKKELLDSLISKDETPLFDKIVNAVTEYYKVSESLIENKGMGFKYKKARSILIYLSRDMLDLSYPKTAKLLNCHHTNVMYSYKKIKSLLDKDKQLVYDINCIKDSVKVKQKKKRKDILHALKEVKGVDDTKDYKPMVWANGFVTVESFLRGNRIVYKLRIPKRFFVGYKDICQYRYKIFKSLDKVYEARQEVEALYVQKQKDLFDKYFENKSY